VWAIVERTQQAIVHRPRPAMPEGPRAAGDDAVRSVVGSEFSPSAGAGLVSFLLVWAGLTGGATRGGRRSRSSARLGCFFLGIALALRARRLVWPSRRSEVEGVPT